jgi:hypothetical protein
LLVAHGLADFGHTADEITLRDLSRVSDRTVTSFDVDGVRLDNGKILSWDEIRLATVAKGQPEFDAFVKELGLPLLRVRQRMKTEAYRGVLEPAEQLLPRYLGRQSETAFVVQLAATQGRIAAGRNEEALVPYLHCLNWMRAQKGEPIPWPGPRQLSVNLATGMCKELPPLWSDKAIAARVLPDVGKAVGAMPRPWPPGVRIYYASLARAAGANDRLEVALNDLPNDDFWGLYRAIALSPSEDSDVLDRLRKGSQQGDSLQRALSFYWLGQAVVTREVGADLQLAAERDRALVDLVRVAALFGEEFPEVAAQSLLAVMGDLQKTGDAAGAVAVRREILDRYGTSAAADRLKAAESK